MVAGFRQREGSLLHNDAVVRPRDLVALLEEAVVVVGHSERCRGHDIGLDEGKSSQRDALTRLKRKSGDLFSLIVRRIRYLSV